MSQPWTRPLLRWAGSKRALLPLLMAATPSRFERYVEPFAGSACLFFALRPARALLSDFNSELMATYRTVRDHPRLVHREAAAWPTDAESYYRVRALADSDLPTVQRAARFVYLNRYCFNGVYRTNRANRFNVPFGNHGGSLPSEREFYRASVALRAAALADQDFAESLTQIRPRDLVYLDPPYSRSASDGFGVYGYGSFTGADLPRMLEVLELIEKRRAYFMFSYTPTSRVLDATAHWHQATMRVRAQVGGSAASRSVRDELLVTNYAWNAQP